MAQTDDLPTRVTALEATVRELSRELHVTRQDALAARVLAGGADRDVAEVRGEIRDFREATAAGLTALRESQLDIRQQMTAGFARVDDKVDRGFAEIRGKFDAAAAGQQRVVELLDTLIAREHGE